MHINAGEVIILFQIGQFVVTHSQDHVPPFPIWVDVTVFATGNGSWRRDQVWTVRVVASDVANVNK